MKDFYDIYYLAQTFDFEGQKLQDAFTKTLNTRGTFLDPDRLDRIFRLMDDNTIQIRWRHFLKVMQGSTIPLSEIMRELEVFLRPICEAIISGTMLIKGWKVELQKWM